MEHFAAQITPQVQFMIAHVIFERYNRFANLAALVTLLRTRGTLAHVKAPDVSVPSVGTAVPSVTVLALERLGVHLFVDVKRSNVLQDDRFHDAFGACERHQV